MATTAASPTAATATTRAPRRYPALLLTILAAVTLYRALLLHFSALDLYLDEAQYWTWAKHLAWGYYSKPPGIAALIAATTAVCGDGALCVKSGALLLYPLITLLVFAIAQRLFDARTAFWCALAFFTLPGAAFSAMIVSTDVPLFLCWTAALYAWLRALDGESGGRRWRWWLLAGLAAGLGLLTKYTMVIFAVSALLHLAVTPRLRGHFRNPKLYAAMVLALLIFAPNLVWNARHGWPTLHHTTQISGLGNSNPAQPGLHLHEWWAFWGGQFAIMGPMFLLAWLGQLALGAREWPRDERYRMLACFALPFLGVIALQALFGRANANWAAMAYAGATIFAVARLIEKQRWRWLYAGIAFNAFVALLAYHYDTFVRAAGIELNHRTDLYKRVRGWSELGRQASLVQAQFPGALLLGDSRDTLAELEYYVQPHPLDAVLWNPRGAIDSHYALTTTMDDKLGRDFVYITRDETLRPEILRSFGFAEALPPLHVSIHPDYALDFRVWHLQGFEGYR